MALLSERKPGRLDGGYSRVLGDPELGALISQVQATSISAGNELEALISTHARVMTASQLGLFLDGKLSNGTYLLSKPLIKKHLKKIIKTEIEPDFVVIIILDKKILCIELKDGDTFDTKKSAGEVASLRDFAHRLHGYLIRQTGLSDYTVDIKFCSFNQDDKDAIVDGMKRAINKKEAMTGREFCKLINISYELILEARRTDMQRNFVYFIHRMAAIPAVKEAMLAVLGNPGATRP